MGPVLVGLVVGSTLLVAPGRTTLAAWTDTSAVSGSTLATGALTPPTLDCDESTGPLLSSAATVSWVPSGWPTTLTYTAVVVETGDPVDVSGNSSAEVYPSLLSSLLGDTITLRVTGSLTGTGWSTSSDQTLDVGLLGAYVDCP